MLLYAPQARPLQQIRSGILPGQATPSLADFLLHCLLALIVIRYYNIFITD